MPSTNEFAAFYRINPATAGKAVNLLVEQGVLYKKRGIGMFVAIGAQEILRRERQAEFRRRYVEPLLAEAKLLGISHTELSRMITETPS